MQFLRIFSISLYLVSLLSLFFYSFVQVDLGLTLTSHPFFLPFQKAFQEIGYFQRPLSTYLYLSILVMMFISYISLLFLAAKQYLSIKAVIILSFFSFFILVFSYNAFSYDLFNYIFDARIFTFYGDNPYEKRALDYPTDYHLGFMRWIHRTYPYGPVWLGVSLPLSFAGLQSLLVTLILFKLLIGVCYLGSVRLIQKIMDHVSKKDTVFAMVFFAFNPLVLIESLVSSHNDVVMMVFALLAIYLLILKKRWSGFISLIFSIGIKFATIFLLPVYIYAMWKKDWLKKFDKTILSVVIFMVAAVLTASLRTQFQPWYLLFILPFAALMCKKDYIFIPVIILSMSSLFNYAPYLAIGNWDEPVPTFLRIVNIAAIVVSLVAILLYRLGRRIIFRPHVV